MWFGSWGFELNGRQENTWLLFHQHKFYGRLNLLKKFSQEEINYLWIILRFSWSLHITHWCFVLRKHGHLRTGPPKSNKNALSLIIIFPRTACLWWSNASEPKTPWPADASESRWRREGMSCVCCRVLQVFRASSTMQLDPSCRDIQRVAPGSVDWLVNREVKQWPSQSDLGLIF